MKKIILTAVIALSMAFTSCSDYLDINNDPQSPNTGNLTPSLIFPGTEMAFCNAYGDYFRIVGGYFAQHSAQQFGTSNYLDYSKFMMSATRSDRAYQQLTMRCLGNMTTVRAMAEASGEWGTALAVAVFRAAAYQTLTDCYGEIPYSEDLDINNVNPKYDNGADIYAGIIAELDNALSYQQKRIHRRCFRRKLLARALERIQRQLFQPSQHCLQLTRLLHDPGRSGILQG